MNTLCNTFYTEQQAQFVAKMILALGFTPVFKIIDEDEVYFYGVEI